MQRFFTPIALVFYLPITLTLADFTRIKENFYFAMQARFGERSLAQTRILSDDMMCCLKS